MEVLSDDRERDDVENVAGDSLTRICPLWQDDEMNPCLFCLTLKCDITCEAFFFTLACHTNVFCCLGKMAIVKEYQSQ